MAEIIFESDQIVRQVPDGAAVCFVADAAKASLPFDCYEGLCETCRVFVTEGMENLKAPNDNECFTLGQEKIGQGYRLGCQIVVTSGRVVLRNGWE